MNQHELELLGTYIAAQHDLIDGKVEVGVSSSGAYRFQGFAQAKAHFQMRMVVLLDEEAARERVDRLFALKNLPAKWRGRRGM